MTAGRRGTAFTPMETRRDVIVRTAVLADELGYEIFSLPEGGGLDPAPVLTEIALPTSRIYLASGILSVWGRTPATLAMTAATLHQVCGGRYVLGLGASTKALVEGFHDTAFEHPAAKLRDVVTKVRALLAGQPAQLGHPSVARPLRLGQPPAPEVPIWVAALDHHTIRVAAELGDGWIPALVARDHLPGWAAQLRQLREAAVPPARPLPVAPGPPPATPAPSPRRGTVPAGSEVVFDQLAAYGTGDQVREQLQAWDHAADIVSILLPPGMPWHNIEATLQAAAPSAAAPSAPPSRCQTRDGPRDSQTPRPG